MNKHKLSLIVIILVIGMMISLSACLDPTNLDLPDLNIRVDGRWIDETAGAFVLNNLSQTINVPRIVVNHESFLGPGIHEGAPKPLTSKAVFANASEDNYEIFIHWEREGARGINPLEVELTMPLPRTLREYYLFMTVEGEVIVTDSLEVVRQRRDPTDTIEVTNIVSIERDPGIDIIAQNIFTATNSGWLTIRNGTREDMSGISIIPNPIDTQLMGNLTQLELSYIEAWRPTLRPRNLAVQELPTTGVRVRAGDYIVYRSNTLIAEVSVQPQSATNYAETNVVTIIAPEGGETGLDPCECGCGKDPCDCADCDNPPQQVSRIVAFILWPWRYASSENDTNNWAGVGDAFTISPILDGPGSIGARQAIADQRIVRVPGGVTYYPDDTQEGTETTVLYTRPGHFQRIAPGEAWLEYVLPKEINGGSEDLVLRIEF